MSENVMTEEPAAAPAAAAAPLHPAENPHVASVKTHVKTAALAGAKAVKHEHVPVMVWTAMTHVQREANAVVAAGGTPLAGSVRKQVVVSTIEDLVDEFSDDSVTDGDRSSIKTLIPGIIDLLAALVQQRDPNIDAFFTDKNVKAMGGLCKKMLCCLPCCGKRRAKPAPAPRAAPESVREPVPEPVRGEPNATVPARTSV